MDTFNEQLFEVIGRLRQKGLNQSHKGKAAAVIKPPCDMIVSDNPNRDKSGNSYSKAASPATQTQQQAETIVNRYFIDRGGSSTGEQVYQCGTHDFETRSIQEFNNRISKTHGNESNSRAASIPVSAHKQKNKAKEIYDFITSNGRI